MISRNDVVRALTAGYGSELNRSKEIDIELVDAMADEVMAAISTELQRNDFYRAVKIGDGGRRR